MLLEMYGDPDGAPGVGAKGSVMDALARWSGGVGRFGGMMLFATILS